MGQESAKPEIQAKYTQSSHASVLTSARKTTIPSFKVHPRVQCDGVLRLRTTPFKNSIEIETESEILFLQNIETTLKQLLESRLNTNKLFLAEDIEKLIEALTFTLAFLQQKGVTYKDITAENIYYDQGNFKLLPNELIENSTYQRLKNGDEVYPSPELIIALRCGQEEVLDDDIIEKSNVFTLGMLLLEVSTLMPSTECYDPDNYDILDEVLNQRLIQVEQYYGERISRIVANMLDYDYTERMNLKQMSIWINRQLRQSKAVESQHEQQVLSTSMLASQIDKPSEGKTSIIQNTSMMNTDKGKSRMTKNNSVYMGYNREGENQREERNRIYINDSSRPEPSGSRAFQFEDARNYKRSDKYSDRDSRVAEKRQFYNVPFNQNDSFKFTEPQKHQLKHPNPYCDDFKYKREDLFQKLSEKDITQRITKQPHRPYLRRNYGPQNQQESERQHHQPYDPPKKEMGALKQIGNQYYPNIEDILKTKQNHNSMEIKGPLGENGALNRIKEEIMKSRKLIEEFKKSEGLKF